MTTGARINWLDYAKGMTIIMVVNMHSNNGLEKYFAQTDWMHGFVEWAQLFRMPLFFILAGLFLSKSLTTPLRSFLDKKVLHFGYFYLLWLGIQSAVKSGGKPMQFLESFGYGLIQPETTLWFIYVLAIFFVVTRVLAKLPQAAVLMGAIALNFLPLETGSVVIDEFMHRWVFFLIGAFYAPQIFSAAEQFTRKPLQAGAWFAGILALGIGAIALRLNVPLHETLVSSGFIQTQFNAITQFTLALIGSAAFIGLAAVLARFRVANFLEYCGKNSLQIYLAFFLFMVPARLIVGKTGIATALPDLSALFITVSAVVGSLIFAHFTMKTPFRFLFERPEWAKLRDRKSQVNYAPAE